MSEYFQIFTVDFEGSFWMFSRCSKTIWEGWGLGLQYRDKPMWWKIMVSYEKPLMPVNLSIAMHALKFESSLSIDY